MTVILTLFFIIFLVVLSSKIGELSKKVEKLEEKVHDLKLQLQGEKPPQPVEPEVIKPSRLICPSCGSILPLVDASTSEPLKFCTHCGAPIAQSASVSARPPEQEGSLKKVASPSKPVSQARTSVEWEALLGAKWSNWIGAVALVFGMGFFLKYAFDNNWLTESVRVLIGFVVGGVLLWSASHFNKKNLRLFPQGLVGAGIAILYLSAYASFNFYHLVSQLAAFFLMSAVTAIAFQQAIRYNSLAVAMLGWGGGFLTPFLLNTGVLFELGFFLYLLLLNVGILAVAAWKKEWTILEVLTLGATYVTYFIWHLGHYTPEKLVEAVVFLTLVFGLFYALDIYRIRTAQGKGPGSIGEISLLVAICNSIFYYGAMYAILNSSYHQWMGLITLWIGAVYFVTALAVDRTLPEQKPASRRYTLTAIAFLAVATWIQFTGFKTILWWSAEAAVLLWTGVRRGLDHVWKAALVIAALAAVVLATLPNAFYYESLRDYNPVLNLRVLAFLALSAVLAFGAFYLRSSAKNGVEQVRFVLHLGWSLLLLTLLGVEINDFFRLLSSTAPATDQAVLSFREMLLLPVVWAAYSVLLVWLGLRMKIKPLLYVGLGILALSAVLGAGRGALFVPLDQFVPLLNVRFTALALLALGLALQYLLLSRYSEGYPWMVQVMRVVKISIALVILELLTAEVKEYFDRSMLLLSGSGMTPYGATELSRLKNLQQLTLSGVWLLYSFGMMILGIWRRKMWLRMMAIILFGATILKIFVFDLSFLSAFYRIFSFIGLGLILLFVSYLYQRYRQLIFGETKEKGATS